jgi:hypothetical protein
MATGAPAAFALAIPEILVLARKALAPSNLFQVARGLALIARPADGGEAIRVVRIVLRVPERQGRAVVKDKEALDQARAAIKASTIPGGG